MIMFGFDQIMGAVEHSQNGGQALYLHSLLIDPNWDLMTVADAVAVTRRTARIYDMDPTRLQHTLKRLGVKQQKVCCAAGPFQHGHLDSIATVRAMLMATHICRDDCDHPPWTEDGEDHFEPEPVA